MDGIISVCGTVKEFLSTNFGITEGVFGTEGKPEDREKEGKE